MITQFHSFLTNNEKLIKQFSVYNMQMTVGSIQKHKNKGNFGRMSGTRLKIEKTEGILLGSLKNSLQYVDDILTNEVLFYLLFILHLQYKGIGMLKCYFSQCN